MKGTGCRIRADAAQYLSEAVQLMAKNVLDSAILHHSQRNNQVGVRAYGNTQGILSLLDGEVCPESRENVGMKWGQDVRSAMLGEAETSNEAATR